MGEFIEACKKIREDKRKKSKKTNIHHIVARTAQDAKPSRDVLEKVNIKVVTDNRNLVEIKESFHQYLHTWRYYNAVNVFFKSFKTERMDYTAEEKQKISNIHIFKSCFSCNQYDKITEGKYLQEKLLCAIQMKQR